MTSRRRIQHAVDRRRTPAGEPIERVWYAAYGSNCDGERLTAYLHGGHLAATGVAHAGSADPAPPQADTAWIFDRALRFAGYSPGWGGATALLADRPGRALGRAWLLSWRQFEDLFAQENQAPHRPLTVVEVQRRRTVWARPYGRLLQAGRRDGLPVVTFTAPRPSTHPAGAPSASYLRTIVRGLLAVHQLGADELAAWLWTAAGVTDGWDRSALRRLVEEVGA